MSIDIGKMRHQISVQSRANTKDANGGQIGAWSTVGTVWAAVQTLTGRKLEQARQIDAEATVEIRTRYCADGASGGFGQITVDNQLLFGSRILEPVYVVNEDEMNICLRVLCKEKRGALE